MDVYWEILQRDVGVESIKVEFQNLRDHPMLKPPERPKHIFNTILVTLTNDIVIRMTIGEWQNMGGEIVRQIKERENENYGKIGEPESGSS